ncbi:MAG: aldose 1-epimerase family protein, partial [Eubacterium sp.]|nr:aldose 1-epimerase family protein [Eubacterium sp.]
EFEIAGQTEASVSFRLNSDAESLKVYPFAFELTIIYALNKNELKTTCIVKNQDNKTMYFSIGAHPAFMVKLDEAGTMAGNYIQFDAREEQLDAKDFVDGLVKHTTHPVKLDADGCMALDEHTFDNGVYIFEHDQAQRVSILDKDKKPYVTVEFNTPLFGIWSPEKKNAPFLCIEPWYGRADADDFNGDLSERRYGNSLQMGVSFHADYRIIFE